MTEKINDLDLQEAQRDAEVDVEAGQEAAGAASVSAGEAEPSHEVRHIQIVDKDGGVSIIPVRVYQDTFVG